MSYIYDAYLLNGENMDTKENRSILSINCPSNEDKETLRKTLKELTGKYDTTTFDFLQKAIQYYVDKNKD